MSEICCIILRASVAVSSGLPNDHGSSDSLNGSNEDKSPQGLGKRVRRLSHKYEGFEQPIVVNNFHFELIEDSQFVSNLIAWTF